MLATILKTRRKELNLTQAEVAETLHLTRQAISSWENGKSYPDIPTLVKLSDLYALSLDYMLKGDPRYMKKIHEDTNRLKEIKKYQWSLWLPLLMILPIFAILQITRQEQNSDTWQYIFGAMQGFTLIYIGWVGYILAKTGNLPQISKIGFGLLLLSRGADILTHLIHLPLAQIMIWPLSGIAAMMILIPLANQEKPKEEVSD